MDKLVIEGGVRLEGTIAISGAKNATLPLMASTLLAPGTHLFENVPHLMDVLTMRKLLHHMGARTDHEGEYLTVDTASVKLMEAPYELVKTMRASVLVLGPLVARFGYARVSLPGGCAIGARPINLHIKALEMLGAQVAIEHGYVVARAKELKGAVITFDQVTVTGTENVLMAASLAKGTTVLENAAREPEVVALADYLNLMGARISGAGTPEIVVEGVSELKPGSFRVIPDRIEAGTYLVAAGITGGHLILRNCTAGHMESVIRKLQLAGLIIRDLPDGLEVWGPERTIAVDAKTWPYPGFPTDMQAQFMALMTISEGVSVITEQIFENRFMHVPELNRLGANIQLDGRSAIVRGVRKLQGAPVMATDLRASASLVLAGLAALGKTEVSRVYHLDRGYERLDEKLRNVGARITRVKE
ncbi:UDP-N-acetylglucosamine 1-carboxyvinyltransferase [Thermodesulforhabdus norvegica]|uniref:UDP-N-acetylglucosamine 1-carboxyvinyltransferase n=1 Tax=Thermodesulforhabdus norvegica TaxID=39841 RepID=A0A1I4V5E2_9BACT|nr:UDP-N-acetylglucosamine 1-carboxyvinyltransferase [Thermodesulforhabdus norvegica]SFM96388.1 UDP-N-acetylglucosamine 1-carboxyvinyltransferase [Thermodesulforhabdus norvegica]